MNPKAPLNTDAERRLLQELNRVDDDYLGAADAVQPNAQPALVSSGRLAQLDAFNVQAERMRKLVRQPFMFER